jgi:hypothetical protein
MFMHKPSSYHIHILVMGRGGGGVNFPQFVFQVYYLNFFVKNISWVMVRFLKVGSMLHSIPPLPNMRTTNLQEGRREKT